jgi:hypothetical protein
MTNIKLELLGGIYEYLKDHAPEHSSFTFRKDEDEPYIFIYHINCGCKIYIMLGTAVVVPLFSKLEPVRHSAFMETNIRIDLLNPDCLENIASTVKNFC